MPRPPAIVLAAGLVAVLVLSVAPVAFGQNQATTPEAVTPLQPRVAQVTTNTVRLQAGRLVRSLRIDVGDGVDGVATVTWAAYGGARSAVRLTRLGQGRAAVQVRDGVLSFTRRVRVGGGFDRSGGFCETVDLSSLGYTMPEAPACPGTPTTSRDQLVAQVPEFSMYGDSVAEALLYGRGATTRAAGHLSAVFDLRTCRRLTFAPCPPNPTSALAAIRLQPGSVGDIAVIDVGYNDWGAVYGIDPVIAALRARGVKRIVWFTLRERESASASINAMIRQAARRHPFIQVADWNARSAGLGGFGPDGVHLSSTSAINALADFVRDQVAQAVRVIEAP